MTLAAASMPAASVMVMPDEDLGLRDVGGQHFGQGQQLGGQGRHGVIPQISLAPEVATITGSTTMCLAL